jgi:phospho-N-acetylmuramoyl-pentapeptide-transferase
MNPNAELPFALALGAFTFILVAIWGSPFVEILRRLKIGKNIREGMPGEHYKKRGTPTMGGIMIILPVFGIALMLNLASLLRDGITGQSILIPLAVLVVFGFLGAYDDWEGLQNARGVKMGLGVPARLKFLMQLLIAGSVLFVMSTQKVQFSNAILIPLIPDEVALPAIVWIFMGMFVIVATSNAVNLIDGLDGLAGTITASAYVAYGLIAALQGQIFLMQFCFIVVGACFGFLWYNAHPAQLFMGDVGSLALGGALGVVALMTGQWFILPLIAIMPFSATASVIIQVSYFKWTGGQRFFKKAPIHHHFEEIGWSEMQVVQRFWLVGILASMIGIALTLL